MRGTSSADTGRLIDWRARLPEVFAFLVPGALLFYYALRGGSYDIVLRQEEAVVVWAALGLGVVLGVLPRARIPGAGRVALAAGCGLALWTAAGLDWTSSDERTLGEVARVLHYVGLLALTWAVVSQRLAAPAVAGVTSAGVLVCALALASRLFPDTFDHSPVESVFQTDRLSYPLDYWNAVAAWGVMTAAMALAWSAHAKTPVSRALALAAVPVCAAAVYLTYSRAGAIGIAVAVLVVFALSRNRWTALLHACVAAAGSGVVILAVRGNDDIVHATGGTGGAAVTFVLLGASVACAAAALLTSRLSLDRARLRPRAGAAAAALLGVVAIVLVAGPLNDRLDTAWREFKNESTAAAGSADDPAARLTSFGGERYNHWRSALRAYESEPLHGIGAGTFEFWWNRDDGGQFVRDAHSLYLEQLAETGLLGLVLTLALFGTLLAMAIGARATDPAPAIAAAAAMALYLVHAGVDWMWETTAVTALALVAVACATGSRETAGAPRWPGRALVGLLALVAAAVQMPGLVGTSRVRDSQAAVRAGDLQDALAAADDAVGAEPWAASPYTQRALVREAAGDLDGAAANLRRAIDREPYDWRVRVILARVEAERGRSAAALREMRAARRLRPRSPFVAQGP